MSDPDELDEDGDESAAIEAAREVVNRKNAGMDVPRDVLILAAAVLRLTGTEV